MTGHLLTFHKPLQGVLLKRYKRFFADVELPDGSVVTAHCTNTGSMKSVLVPGQPVVLSTAKNLERKLKYTWEAIRIGHGWVGINTANPNTLVAEALAAGLIKDFGYVQDLQREVVVAPGTRLDFSFTLKKKKVFVEVKNVTMAETVDGRSMALFPDSVSERGTKHLKTLADLAHQGHRAVIFYVVQRLDCKAVAAAAHIDPVYAETLRAVVSRGGVEPLACAFRADTRGVGFSHRLPVMV